jgi:hypothetical protein
MGAAAQYCREISDAFSLVAVYPPGTSLGIGDIIKFDKSSLLHDKKGAFTKQGSLKKLKISYETEDDNTMGDYAYASKKSTSINTSIVIENVINTEVTFSADGSVYMDALNCTSCSIKDMVAIQKALNSKRNLREYDNFYLITKLITGSEAVIMQSSGNNSSLGFTMDQIPGTPIKNANLQVTHSANETFIIKAKKNVTILMALHQIKIKSRVASSSPVTIERHHTGPERLIPQRNVEENEIILEKVDNQKFYS